MDGDKYKVIRGRQLGRTKVKRKRQKRGLYCVIHVFRCLENAANRFGQPEMARVAAYSRIGSSRFVSRVTDGFWIENG